MTTTVLRFLVVAGTVFVLLTALTWRRVCVVSPSEKKTVTFFRPFSLSVTANHWYLIPGRYGGVLAPDTGFVLVEPKGECMFFINWESERSGRIKMHLTSTLLTDKLDTTQALYATKYDGYLDRYEMYHYPKHC